ncbi:MAG: hypothetical protein QOD24_5026 [Solirubrobacteraceae bacterium]|nr:hypothetical protein [Solirubrobacteraceae bacterium]
MFDLDGRVGIRVAIVGDEALVRAALAQVLGQASDIVVVGEASDGDDALTAVVELRPDVVVLMHHSVGRLNGAAATRRILAAHPAVRILVLSSYVDRRAMLDALDAGAVGYLSLDSDPEELVFEIRAAVSGGARLVPRAAGGVVVAWREVHEWGELTARERDVLVLLAEGLPNRVIAQRLGIAEKTVKAHVTHVFDVLAVTDRTQAALWVGQHGLSPRQQHRRDQLRAAPQAGAA